MRSDGLAAVLVTGRILTELDETYPEVAQHFDAVVAENGAVLAVEGDVRNLNPPVEPVLGSALTERRVPFRSGRVLLAGDAAHAPAVLDAVGSLGLDCQIVRDRGALMVVPAGVSKGTGLLAALTELGISPHNALAVGDAENDLALIDAAEVGVAVANAVPSCAAPRAPANRTSRGCWSSSGSRPAMSRSIGCAPRSSSTTGRAPES